ncbi:C40 family peptidase [Bowmanella dokdonensis]|uniref:C40 family peptidase n=1 Tax=Bowmanella dokdonensis TaxID=751969 RepID=A0A939DM46_9ALTE|nr:NlpC/P60 family protein [Bowmanella dokdonensis]MBN7825289.1 C40 family peptidase [Bowmanella dokdonensis]
MKPLTLPLLSAALFCTPWCIAQANEPIHQQSLQWLNKPYRVGEAEQCMNWTRKVLKAACGEQFASLETQTPWDKHLLGEDDQLLPEHADSLASEEFGIRLSRIEDLQPGDLVFLHNTYGNWAEGVITHVGIAVGEGQYIHRMTSNQGLVKIQPIPGQSFNGAIRLKAELCPGN